MNGTPTGTPLKVQVAVAVVGTAAFLYFLPALDRWVKARLELAAPVHAIALPPNCREPQEGEQRLYIVDIEAGKARVLDCMYYVSRGHRRRALQAAQ